MKRYVRPISLRPTRDEFAISSRVLGTLHWLHAAYNDAATTPSIDRPRDPFLVVRLGRGRACAALFLALLHEEGPPFWPLVDHLVRQDEAAFLTDELAALVIERQVARVALGASSDFFGFFDLLCRHGLPQQRTRRLQSTTARRPRPAVRPRRARGQVRRP